MAEMYAKRIFMRNWQTGLHNDRVIFQSQQECKPLVIVGLDQYFAHAFNTFVYFKTALLLSIETPLYIKGLSPLLRSYSQLVCGFSFFNSVFHRL